MAVLLKTSVPIERVMIVGEIRPKDEPRLASFVGQQLPKQEILNCFRYEARNTTPNSKAEHELIPGEFRLISETAETYTVAIVINEALHRFVV